MPVKCQCKRCGKTSYLKPCAIRRGRGKFCSKKCQYAYKTDIGVRELTCSLCQKTFKRTLYKINVITRKDWKLCCSRHCRITQQQQLAKPKPPKVGIATGSKHWNWQGGKTEISSTIRTMPGYITWRTAIFTRDNYTCQLCQKRGSYLQADHIIPLAELIALENIKTRKDARKSASLWNTNNGRTLCLSCHKKTPTFGIKYARHRKKQKKGK